MRALWMITDDIEKRYKDGDDWVYAKGKKTEIELIKELLEKCVNLRDVNHDLRKKLEVLDKWEAYWKAEGKLSDVRHALYMWTIGLEELDTARDKLNEACTALKESEDYVKSVKDRLLGEEAKEKNA